jgi:hypothetical protein
MCVSRLSDAVIVEKDIPTVEQYLRFLLEALHPTQFAELFGRAFSLESDVLVKLLRAHHDLQAAVESQMDVYLASNAGQQSSLRPLVKVAPPTYSPGILLPEAVLMSLMKLLALIDVKSPLYRRVATLMFGNSDASGAGSALAQVTRENGTTVDVFVEQVSKLYARSHNVFLIRLGACVLHLSFERRTRSNVIIDAKLFRSLMLCMFWKPFVAVGRPYPRRRLTFGWMRWIISRPRIPSQRRSLNGC